MDDTLLLDLRYALRALRRSPGFAAGVTLTLALGIGATTAVFSLLDAVLLRPLPVRAPEELADIYTTCRRGDPYCSSSYPDFLEYRDQNRSFVDMAAFEPITVNITTVGPAGPSRVGEAMLATGNYFGMLGIGPALGRLIEPGDDDIASPQPVAVLSHRAWVRDFGADPTVVDRGLRLNGIEVIVIGVVPPEFRGTRITTAPDLWLPMSMVRDVLSLPGVNENPLAMRGMRWIGGIVGRRQPSVSIDAARADLLRVSQALQEDDPAARGGRSVTVEPARALTLPAPVAGDIVFFVALVLGGVASALLIACCANVSGLLLARAGARSRELVIRQALGAGRLRLIRELLTESFLLSILGSIGGVALAAVGFRLLSTFALPGTIPIASLELGLTLRVLIFAIGLTFFSALLFGIMPSLQMSRTATVLATGLRATADGRSGPGGRHPVLLALQTAITVTLLFAGGIFIRSLQNGLALDVGFSARNVVIASVNPSLERYDGPRTLQFLDAAVERLRQTPGVERVTTTILPPLAPFGMGFFAQIDGYVPAPNEEIRIETNLVGADYFRTMGIPLVSGRDFTDRDRAGSSLVAVINDTMARRYWAGRHPVGQRVRIRGLAGDLEVVGWARDVTYGLTGRPQPFVYLPMRQYVDLAGGRLMQGEVTLLAATAGSADVALPRVRDLVRELDPLMPIVDVTTITDRFSELLMPQQLGGALLSGLATLTLVLVAAGIAGTVTFMVGQRRKEVGIRLALGASRFQVAGLVSRAAVVPVVAGLAVGLAGGFASARAISRFTYGVAPADPVTFVTSTLVLTIVAAVAAYVPARRATRLNPVEVLREE